MCAALIRPLLADIKNFILDILFPICCICCEAEGQFVCTACRGKFVPVPGQKCLHCGKPAPFGLTHAGCQTPQGADGLISFFDYRQGGISQVIIRGKYLFLPAAFTVLGGIAAEHIIRGDYQLPRQHAYLVPLPLAGSRLRWRGFNQSQVLAETVGKKLNLPVVSALIRIRSTKVQKDLNREGRIKNVAGAFGLSPRLRPHAVRGKNFIVVDDVTTTGSTLMEAVKVLKRNGAAAVWCLTVARD